MIAMFRQRNGWVVMHGATRRAQDRQPTCTYTVRVPPERVVAPGAAFEEA